MTKAEEILSFKPTDAGRNSMGCSELWYYPYYAIQQTFTEEEIKSFTEEELNRLIKLADKIAEGLY